MPYLNDAGSIVGGGRSASGPGETGGGSRFLRSKWLAQGAIGYSIPREERRMLRAIGKAGQLLGLTVPAVAILLELNHRISLGQMLMLLVAAVCCFWIGRIHEGYSRP